MGVMLATVVAFLIVQVSLKKPRWSYTMEIASICINNIDKKNRLVLFRD